MRAAEDGLPLAGATVEPMYGYLDEPTRALTDADGRYTVRMPYECIVEPSCWISQMEVVAHLEGFHRGWAPRRAWTSGHDLSAHQDTARLTLDFALPSSRPIILVLTGRVGLASTGEPIEGAEVAVDWAYNLPFELPQPSTATGADGRYELIADHFCAIDGSPCRASFQVRAEWNGLISYRTFEEVEVTGDSLAVAVGFHDF